ncbi:MAG: hypothetical protein WBG71_05050 [Leeuwenhoekiella sp.]
MLLLLAATVTSCANQKQLVEDPPFAISSPYYRISESRQDSLREDIRIYLPIRELKEGVEPQRIYFLGKETNLTKQLGSYYFGKMSQIKEEAKWNIVISSDMGEEINNPLPELEVEPPIKKESDEAVLVYTENGKEWYYILKPKPSKTPR